MSNFDRNAPVWGAGRAQQTSAVEMDQGLRSFMLGVYNNMSIGLAITGLAAIGISMLAIAGVSPTGKVTALTPLGQALYLSPLKWVVMLAPLAFILFFSFKAESMSSSSARAMFFAFAAVMGVSLSSIFVVYTGESITKVFFITAATFGALSLYGYTTKKSLSAMGSFLIMGLIGLVIASVVNIFLQSSALSFAVSAIGVLVFAGLTAWDTQRLKEMYLYSDMNPEEAAKLSVNGALSLYLNFINMFQMLLSLFGSKQE
ncbi:MAG: Bax inhibitor-1/YccA family protein [Bosea sp. (in: a-proteobacteria)]|jgi:FtsH-binding integral membrane protein|uniref:Bax inhibitor-1/YccA family protein n=1 Tax=unclassified Bosea (in: a-proteobacteria) TaxID=2653178 RepID=UPI00083D0A6A|nr:MULTISPECIES: Bax inhibitor-1/YccA family protein [unclassified Bosea (in: a-proteobacteria)]MBA4333766.1 BAX inhibitor (BI)-1/YccA family protein [Methylobacterium sp.]MBX9875210.1 Bax inhibitor-1/YccA family protein [Beijerinckiaceae bacterium]AOG07114.1 inhibitor of apoptosis-promoting Bax1 family protein [Bosea sp. RAC05]MCZ8045004.1 Bax inhibitor-1/YccA family protein [Beijerinckiaceae bacterium]MDP3602797.1 Bax inhibitor-1/YccA family protein [Bosea sp. (in: a-proteobacteria)]